MVDRFVGAFLHHLRPGALVLDVGAGRAEFSHHFLAHGYRVLGIDILPRPRTREPSLKWLQADIRSDDWFSLLPTDVSALFCRNVFHYYSKDWAFDVITRLRNHMPGLRVAGFQAFWSNPDPAFEAAFSSYWTTSELSALLPDFKSRWVSERWHLGRDFNEVSREFPLAQVVLLLA